MPVVQPERGAQDLMPPGGEVPGRLEGLPFQRGYPVEGDLDDIDAVIGEPQVVKEHALLSGQYGVPGRRPGRCHRGPGHR